MMLKYNLIKKYHFLSKYFFLKVTENYRFHKLLKNYIVLNYWILLLPIVISNNSE